MAIDESDAQTADRPGPLFVTTHWSVVLAAGHGDTPRSCDALSRLCQTYWYPLYAYARRRGWLTNSTPERFQDTGGTVWRPKSLLSPPVSISKST
jgi:RNA polymerase sigma-70 factor (ECF subfamily)